MVSKRIQFGLFFLFFFLVAHLLNLKVRFETNSNLPHFFYFSIFIFIFNLRFRRGEKGSPGSCLLINNRARLMCLEANN